MKTMIASICLAACSALLAGCATDGSTSMGNSVTPQLDARFGDAVRQARALQTLNPTAGRTGDPVIGIDGRAGAAAIERYHESFRSPPQSFDVLNIGGGAR
jgi:hypothetical protein